MMTRSGQRRQGQTGRTTRWSGPGWMMIFCGEPLRMSDTEVTHRHMWCTVWFYMTMKQLCISVIANTLFILTAIFQVNLGLPVLKLKMMEVVVTTGAMSRSKLSHKIITTNKPTPNFLQAGCPSFCPTNSVRARKEKYHIPWTLLPQAHLGVFQLCLWQLIAPGYLSLSLSILMTIFPGEPGLASFVEAKDDGSGGGNCYSSYKTCKAFLQAGCPSCRPTNSVKTHSITA